MKNNLVKLFILLFIISGCAGKNSHQMTTYTISPNWDDTSVNKVNNSRLPGNEDIATTSVLTIKLAPMRTTQALASTQLLYSDARYILGSYAYSLWNDKPAELLQILFQVSLQESKLFKAVLPSTSSSKSDLLLESTLFDLSHHLKQDGTSESIVRIQFYIIDHSTKKIIASRQFSSTITALSNNAHGAVVAINTATGIISNELVHWLSEQKF